MIVSGTLVAEGAKMSQLNNLYKMGQSVEGIFYELSLFSCDILAPPATNVPLTIIEEVSH